MQDTTVKPQNAFTAFFDKYGTADAKAETKTEDRTETETETEGQEQSHPCPSLNDTFSVSLNAPPNSQHFTESSNEGIGETTGDILQKISSYKWAREARTAKNGRKFLSKRLVLGTNTELQAAVCKSTGIVYGILMPATLQGKAFEIESPFSYYDNCRGLVQEGRQFLQKQNAQILAGILITLAEHYLLIQSKPMDTGAYKNALLRTVDREVLIDAIILVETWVNSTSAAYLPKLSLLTDAEPNNMNDRLRRWLSTCVNALYKPDRKSFEETIEEQQNSLARKESFAERKAKAALQTEWKRWRKEAKQNISELHAAGLISIKLKTYFLAIISDNAILSTDPAIIAIMGNKLQQLENVKAISLGKQLLHFHKSLTAQEQEEFEDTLSFASQQLGTYEQSEDEAEEQDEQTGQDEQDEGPNSRQQQSNSQTNSSGTSNSNLLQRAKPQAAKQEEGQQSSFIQRLLAKRKAAQGE